MNLAVNDTSPCPFRPPRHAAPRAIFGTNGLPSPLLRLTAHSQGNRRHRPRAHRLTRSPGTQNLKPRTLAWLVAISLVVAGMVWLTLYQIRTIAIDHGPTSDEIAQCRAGLSPDEAAEWIEHCETEAEIIWAARHPLRNSLAVLVLLLAVGYATLALNQRYRNPIPRP